MPEPIPEHPVEPRWPAIVTLVTAWACPARSARRTRHVSLWSAYAMHLTCAVLTFLLIVGLVAASENKTPVQVLRGLFEEITADLVPSMVAIGVIVLVVEGGFVLTALLITPWGAGDERLRSSWANTFRVTWLHSAHALPAVFLVGVLSLAVEHAMSAHSSALPLAATPAVRPSPPPRPDVDSAGEAEWQAYIEARAQYQKECDEAAVAHQRQYVDHWTEWERSRPFLARYGPAVVVWTGTGCVFWILWALLRAAGARRCASASQHPPICEFCGYNLTATPIESRCPECGELAVESLGPHVRPGTPWDRRAEAGRLRAWRQSGVSAVFRPEWLGRQVQVWSHAHGYRVFFAIHLPIMFLFGASAAAGCLFYDWCKTPGALFLREMMMITPPFFGGLTVLAGLIITGTISNLVGLAFTWRNGRNLLPASIRPACYLGAYMMLWTAFGSALAVALYFAAYRNLTVSLAEWVNMSKDGVAFFLWCLLNLPWLGGYAILVWKGTAAAQYANR